jgi:hypothetical protein
MAEKTAQDAERRRKEEEIQVKQQEILAQIETEKARYSLIPILNIDSY